MQLTYAPLLSVQRELYRLPRGRARFDAYLRTLRGASGDDIELPLTGLNPMAGDHVPSLLDTFLQLGAEHAAGACVAELAAELADLPGAYRVALVLADDAKGKWTDRAATEFEHLCGDPALRRRGWIVGLLWSSETPTLAAVRGELRAAVHRAAVQAAHPAPATLADFLVQEHTVLRRAGPVRGEPDWSEAALGAARRTVGPLMSASDRGTLLAALFGDEAAHALGHAPLGLPARAGFALAWRHVVSEPRGGDLPDPGATMQNHRR